MSWFSKIERAIPSLNAEMVLSLARRGLFRKLLNYLVANIHYARRDATLWSYPIHLCIDPSTRCTLRCPICAVGSRNFAKPMTDMPFATFKRIMDELGPYALVVELFLKGEPFLNKDIYDIISYCRKFHVETRLSTNMQFKEKDGAERLVESGLQLLLASVDGVTQESYAQYRIGGNVELAFENMRRVVEAKKRLKRYFPVVEWKFIVFRHNEHEIETAKKMAAELGVDRLTFIGASLGADSAFPEKREKWLPKDPRFRAYDGDKPIKTLGGADLAPVCNLPWISLCVDPLGHVQSCTRSERPENDHGDFQKNFFWKVWNGPRFRQSRRYVRQGYTGSDKSNLCAGCPDGALHSFVILTPEPTHTLQLS
jgi:MoaA/NifB/PqqE/SkfB family radical SAM enzyme